MSERTNMSVFTVTIPVPHPGLLQPELDVRFTDAAVAHLDNGNLAAVAGFCLADLIDVSGLDGMEAGDDYDLSEVMFHVIETYGLIITFDSEGAWLDVVEHKHAGVPIAGGPLAGKMLVMPVGKMRR